MIKLTSATQVFGPFKTVEVLDDRYRCDGDLELLFNVVGQCSQSEWTDAFPDRRNAEQLAIEVRDERDQRLADTDWVVIKHLELNQNIPGVWEVYRQALRDIPEQAGFPWDILWPTHP